MTKPAPIVFDSTGHDGTTTATVPHAGVLGGEFNAEELQRVKEEMVRSPHSAPLSAGAAADHSGAACADASVRAKVCCEACWVANPVEIALFNKAECRHARLQSGPVLSKAVQGVC